MIISWASGKKPCLGQPKGDPLINLGHVVIKLHVRGRTRMSRRVKRTRVDPANLARVRRKMISL